MATTRDPPRVTDSHVFFFGHEGSQPEITFSQFYPASFEDPSTKPPTTFPTCEHYMMYQKALLFGDNETAVDILCSDAPIEAKKLGRKVRNFNQARWDAKCDDIVERGNWLKFSQNQKCMKALLATGSRKIVEASPSDRVWGVGFSVAQAEGKQDEWGENKLGKALERVRDRLGMFT